MRVAVTDDAVKLAKLIQQLTGHGAVDGLSRIPRDGHVSPKRIQRRCGNELNQVYDF